MTLMLEYSGIDIGRIYVFYKSVKYMFSYNGHYKTPLAAYIELNMQDFNYFSAGAYIGRYMMGSYNDRYMKTYMNEIWNHILGDIEV